MQSSLFTCGNSCSSPLGNIAGISALSSHPSRTYQTFLSYARPALSLSAARTALISLSTSVVVSFQRQAGIFLMNNSSISEVARLHVSLAECGSTHPLVSGSQSQNPITNGKEVAAQMKAERRLRAAREGGTAKLCAGNISESTVC